ncbi:MAG: hypothetical protein AAF849_14230 [Bacteroidota bacterium]
MRTRTEKGFAAAFEFFDERSMLSDLHNKVKPKSFYHQHKAWKAFVLVLSYLFNLISVATTGLSAFLLVDLMGGSKALGIVIGILLVIALEVIKRKSSSEFWQVRFFRRRWATGWLILSLSIAGISIFSSSYGTKKGTTEFASDPELLAKSETLEYYYSEVEKLDKEIEDLRNNKNSKGVTFYKLYPTINKKTETVESYRTEIMRLESELEGKNEQLTDDYQQNIEITGWALVTVVVICEICFELCIAYIWYFYFRSYVEKLIEEGRITDVQDFYRLIEDQEAYDLQLSRERAATLPSAIPDGLENKEADTVYLSSSSEDDLIHEIERLRAILSSGNGSVQSDSGSVQSGSSSVQRQTVDDRYSVEHRYRRGDKWISVRYTMPTITSRINQYDKELKEAKQKGSGEVVIENLTSKLQYWMDKKEELQEKLLSVNQK